MPSFYKNEHVVLGAVHTQHRNEKSHQLPLYFARVWRHLAHSSEKQKLDISMFRAKKKLPKKSLL
jgi:hypothetical protein